jgi:hypothetical protein
VLLADLQIIRARRHWYVQYNQSNVDYHHQLNFLICPSGQKTARNSGIKRHKSAKTLHAYLCSCLRHSDCSCTLKRRPHPTQRILHTDQILKKQHQGKIDRRELSLVDRADEACTQEWPLHQAADRPWLRLLPGLHTSAALPKTVALFFLLL